MDWLYFANAGLIALFFYLFGSRFVLSPGLGVDFELPHVAGANANAQQTTHVITVVNAGQILADGVRNLDELQPWLNAQAKTVSDPSLLIRSSARVPTGLLTEIAGMATEAQFKHVIVAAEEQGTAAKVEK